MIPQVDNNKFSEFIKYYQDEWNKDYFMDLKN